MGLVSNEHLAIGYRIGGHYEIMKVLGQGGFGIVYLVKDIHRLDAKFVIKELFSREFSFRHRDGKTVYNRAEAKHIFEKIRDDIISEVNILERIRNRNIVQAYGYFEENNTLYSIMEFIDGIDLDKYLKKVPPYTEREAKDLLLQIIHGIKEIHNLNILHRDIKPSNIMRTADGVYKIIDFTTNRKYEDNKMTTVTAFQSPIYTPPELSGNKRAIIGRFSDIYSIGMTICRVMAEDEEIFPNITDRLIDDSEFQSILNQLEISSEFRQILTKMTELDPEDRFQRLEEIETLLVDRASPTTNWRDEVEIESEPKTRTKKVKTPKEPKKRDGGSSSNSSLFTIIAVLATLLLVALGAYAYKIIQKDKQKAQQERRGSEVSTYTPKVTPTPEPTEEIKEVIKPIIVPTPEMYEEEIATPTPIQTPLLTPTPTSTPQEEESIEVVATPRPIITPHRNNISLGTLVQPHQNQYTENSVFTRGAVQNFLLTLMRASEDDSVDRILSYYNYRVDRYFSLRNVTHREIYRDRVRYNRRWGDRKFRLISFDILRRYERGGVEYCDVQKRVSYRVVSTSTGKVAQGTSRVHMTLKNSSSGFKVTSIYSIK